MLSGLTTIFLLQLCAAVDKCQWRFGDCVRVGEKCALECNVTLHLLNGSLDKCGDRLQTKTILLDSEQGVKFDDKCDINGCAIRPVWCPWEGWSEPPKQCKKDRMVRRQKRLCCHPTTLRRDTRVQCGLQIKHESRKLPRLQCDDDSDLQGDSQVFRNVTLICIGLFASLLSLFVSCCCYRSSESRMPSPMPSEILRPPTSTFILTSLPQQTPTTTCTSTPSQTQRPPTPTPTPSQIQRPPTPTPVMPQQTTTLLTATALQQPPTSMTVMPQQPLASTPVLRQQSLTSTSRMQQRPSASAPVLTRQSRGRFIETQLPPDIQDTPAFLENDRIINPLTYADAQTTNDESEPPPSYDAISSAPDSAPPRYEAAIMFVP